MTKATLTLAAALLAGTTLTSAANAGGIRVGFGFPLGSFVAHSNQSYSGEGYGHRNCNHRHYAARPRHHRPTKVAKTKRKPKVEVASKPDKQIVKTAKLEDKLVTDESTTTVTTKTPATANSESQPTETTNTTTSSIDKSSTTTPAKPETVKVEKTASVDSTPDTKTTSVTAKVKHVCRRFSAAVAGLVDVPCQ